MTTTPTTAERINRYDLIYCGDKCSAHVEQSKTGEFVRWSELERERQQVREVIVLVRKAMPPCQSRYCSPSDPSTLCHRCKALAALAMLEPSREGK